MANFGALPRIYFKNDVLLCLFTHLFIIVIICYFTIYIEGAIMLFLCIPERQIIFILFTYTIQSSSSSSHFYLEHSTKCTNNHTEKTRHEFSENVIFTFSRRTCVPLIAAWQTLFHIWTCNCRMASIYICLPWNK